MCTVLLKGGSDPNIKAEVTYDIKRGGFDLGIKLQRGSSCPGMSNIIIHCEVEYINITSRIKLKGFNTINMIKPDHSVSFDLSQIISSKVR